jgi:hypothetical protein
VQNQVDRERWGDIDVPHLHPLNQEEVADVDGAKSLSGRDGLFFDDMTLTRVAF